MSLRFHWFLDTAVGKWSAAATPLITALVR